MVKVEATDEDAGDTITYEVVSSSGDGTDLFLVIPSTGEVRLKKPATDSTSSLYNVRLFPISLLCYYLLL